MAEVMAVFDLEGTLCQGRTVVWSEIIKWRLRHGCNIAKVMVQVLFQVSIALVYRLGLISEGRARLTATRSMAGIFKGITGEEFEQFADMVAAKLAARMRPDTQKILQDHIEKGHRVVLMSTLFEPILEAVGGILGVQVCIGTKLEKEDDRHTGRLSGVMCFHDQRALMLKEYISEASIQVDLNQSYAYGDMIWDKPVLEMVGNPVAVYPDAKLRAHAHEQGWRVIG